MELANLSLTSIKLCSPVVVFIVYVIVSGISLFMTRNTLKKFKNQRMENLYNLYSWSEVKLTIIMGVIIYGLCQYEQTNLAWIYLIFPIIYVILKNSFIFAYVSIAHQNAPKDVDPSDLFEKVNESLSGPASGTKILPETPIVKKEVDTTIFGMRGDQDGALQMTPPTPPTVPSVSTPIDQIENYSGNFPGGEPGGPSLDSFFGGLNR
tara:strand:+ start:2218 stop:2841 length:624 start_codon:yes stop_codon:yes gene_type:complete